MRRGDLVSLMLFFGARKYTAGAKLIPEGDDRAYGLFEQACSVEQSYFAAAAETIGTELVIKKSVIFSTLSPK